MEKERRFVRETSQDALITEKSDIFLNGLLGVYDNNGNYFISPKIIEELIKIEKAKKYVFDNSMYCESNIPGIGEIMFQIEYSKIDKEKSSAKLFILENVYKINGYLQNTIKTFLYEYTDTFQNFIEKSYSAFNIVVDYDENGRNKKVTMDTYLDYYLMTKKQFLLTVQSDVQEKLDDLYKKYFSKKVKILNSSKNPFSKSVLKDFKEEYDKIEKKFLQNCDYKTVNELLDKCVEDVSGTKESYAEYEADFEEKTKPALQDFYKSSNVLFENAQNSAMNNLYKKDKQRMNVINETEKEFMNKAVSKTKLSRVIDALSVDEFVGDESDYEEERADSLEDIIAKIKQSKQEDLPSNISENDKKQVQNAKPIIKPKYNKNLNNKNIESNANISNDYNQFSTADNSEQVLDSDGDVIEHPQMGYLNAKKIDKEKSTQPRVLLKKHLTESELIRSTHKESATLNEDVSNDLNYNKNENYNLQSKNSDSYLSKSAQLYQPAYSKNNENNFNDSKIFDDYNEVWDKTYSGLDFDENNASYSQTTVEPIEDVTDFSNTSEILKANIQNYEEGNDGAQILDQNKTFSQAMQEPAIQVTNETNDKDAQEVISVSMANDEDFNYDGSAENMFFGSENMLDAGDFEILQ